MEIIMNQVHSKKIKVGDLDIKYVSGGHGAPTVVIHGALGGARGWLRNLTELAKTYSVYAPDLPGFGNSQSISDDFQVSEFVDFIKDFTDSLGIKRFHLVGHSLGGGIALHFALKHPHKIDRLVIVSSMFLGKEIALWTRLFSSPYFLKLFGEAGIAFFMVVGWLHKRLHVPSEFNAPFTRTQMSVGRNLVTSQGQVIVLRNQLSKLMVPTLVVWGSRDEVIPVKHADTAARLIPNCQLYIFEGGRHNIFQQRNGEFSTLITGFLGRVKQR
jgi:pimeloyl-ACP methyl ester carboxylesterase